MRGIVLALGASLLCSVPLVLLAGADPAATAAALWQGAFGSSARIVFAVNRATPIILCGTGVALCFRAGIVNIGGEGQIVIGGLCAAICAGMLPGWPGAAAIPLALLAALLGGAGWACVAGALNLVRGVSMVVATLLLNFVAVLLSEAMLHGPLGEIGAGVLQSPLLPPASHLPTLGAPGLYPGIVLAVMAALAGGVVLQRTRLGFAWRVIGASPQAAAYAGFSTATSTLSLLAAAGGLAGLAGGIEVLGVQQRLIDGFSRGFGFDAIAVALLAALKPWAVIPAGLFFAFLETGTAAMQRRVGVPSSLVVVIQGVVMLSVLAATSRRRAA
jgi:ABC-type uncharacterized transport system permease subunit